MKMEQNQTRGRLLEEFATSWGRLTHVPERRPDDGVSWYLRMIIDGESIECEVDVDERGHRDWLMIGALLRVMEETGATPLLEVVEKGLWACDANGNTERAYEDPLCAVLHTAIEWWESADDSPEEPKHTN